MAKRAMMFCPKCRMVGLPAVELVFESPEPDVYRCPNSHAIEGYMNLMKMNPEMIKVVAHETPQPNQIKREVWIDKNVSEKFDQAYPAKLNATVESIMTLQLTGEIIIIDGQQAKKLRAWGVRTGAEMLAAIEVGRSLEDQLATAQQQIALYQGMFQAAGVPVG
jgi:hypothetical protein